MSKYIANDKKKQYLCSVYMATKLHIVSLAIARWISLWIVYPVCYYIVRYRRKVVRKNLCLAFPQKSKHDIQQLEKRFYRNFAQMIGEVIVSARFSQVELLEYITYRNPEVVEKQCKAHNGCFLMLGHFINWEWQAITGAFLTRNGQEFGVVYKQQKNAFFDKLIHRLRERCGGFLIEMRQLLRVIVQRKNAATPIPTFYAMLADQRPRIKTTRHWTTFLGIETDMLMGTEQLAIKYQFPVYYTYIRYLANGTCEMTFEPLYIPEQDTNIPHGTITERFARLLEKNVLEMPDRWLWTHNRFSHRKPTEE